MAETAKSEAALALLTVNSPVTNGVVKQGDVYCMECNKPCGVECKYEGLTFAGEDVWECPNCGEEYLMSMFDWANMEDE